MLAVVEVLAAAGTAAAGTAAAGEAAAGEATPEGQAFRVFANRPNADFAEGRKSMLIIKTSTHCRDF